jgi:hypothetical protein
MNRPGSAKAASSATRCRQAFAALTSSGTPRDSTTSSRLTNFSAPSSAASRPINLVGRSRVGIRVCTAPRAATFMAAKVQLTAGKVSARGTLKVADSLGQDGASMLAIPARIATHLNSKTSASKERIGPPIVIECLRSFAPDDRHNASRLQSHGLCPTTSIHRSVENSHRFTKPSTSLARSRPRQMAPLRAAGLRLALRCGALRVGSGAGECSRRCRVAANRGICRNRAAIASEEKIKVARRGDAAPRQWTTAQ